MARGRLIALSEGERAMKVQEVILRAMSGEIKWVPAAQILNISARQVRRWRKRYERHGYDRLFDRRRQRGCLTATDTLRHCARSTDALPGGVCGVQCATFP